MNKKGINVICIDRVFDKNNKYKIVKYIIANFNDTTNKTEVCPSILKSAIKYGLINCVNLTLTSDNRLILSNKY